MPHCASLSARLVAKPNDRRVLPSVRSSACHREGDDSAEVPSKGTCVSAAACLTALPARGAGRLRCRSISRQPLRSHAVLLLLPPPSWRELCTLERSPFLLSALSGALQAILRKPVPVRQLLINSLSQPFPWLAHPSFVPVPRAHLGADHSDCVGRRTRRNAPCSASQAKHEGSVTIFSVAAGNLKD